MAPSPTSTARSRKSITKRTRSACRSRSSAARHRWSWSFHRSKKPEGQGGWLAICLVLSVCLFCLSGAAKKIVVPAVNPGEPRSLNPGAITRKEYRNHGEKNRWFCQAASASGQGQSIAADRARAGPARLEHHGVLQVVQRADPGCRAGPAAACRDHGIRGQE